MESDAPNTESDLDHEVIVIGAGVAGLYQMKRLVDAGIDAIGLEGNDDLGGTWYNNRYPGARFDSESYTYGYSWSRELLDDWDWTEHFAPQPETLRYLNHVADRFDLRRHFRFNTRVDALTFDEGSDRWEVRLEGGEVLVCRVVITAIGVLSMPTYPRIDGVDRFQGPSFHPFHWPAEGIDLVGKRVAVIGTGATAIQLIPEVAKEASQLTVFQRRPNWAAPLNNGPISPEEMADIRSRYDEIFEQCRQSAGGFLHSADRRGFWNLSREERLAFWDELYDGPGFGIWLANFIEIVLEAEANAEFSEYIADRIRGRVDDPELAEKLIPRDHGFGVQRVPLETGYFETYNRDNVTLVDASETPIECVTETGIQTTEGHQDFDVIVYATGFDAFTGGFDKMTISGVDGQRLTDKWADGPRTYVGLMVSGFPNFVMLAGPQIAATNFPQAIEAAVDWTSGLLDYAAEHGHRRFEAEVAAEDAWQDEVKMTYDLVLTGTSKGWITGYNSNVDGHEYGTIRYNTYQGGAPRYQTRISAIADEGYDGVRFG
ncbi:MAG: NAD(P)/FAD-dependent oxidoreductase [Actinomycetota bacterium]